MAVLEELKQVLDEGDPEIRKWFLVNSYFLPPALCIMYILFIKKIGPALMRDRKPYDLRNVMVVYNFALVAVYTSSILTMLKYAMSPENYKYLCSKTSLYDNDVTYQAAIIAYNVYISKYVEFLDTVFFILRKKDHLVTNLHVIHHASLPFIGWIIIRTELSGFQMFPAMINAFVHIIMYTYYGLAAMGPEFRKYLWWKRQLTIVQMTQFVIIFIFVAIVGPMLGCQTSKHGLVIVPAVAILFFMLFYNFYVQTYERKPKLQNQNQNGYVITKEQHCSNHETKCEAS